VGIGDYGARTTVNLKGAYLASGLIDGHIHVESTMLTPGEFARAVVPRGTTAVVSDPHEIANVAGKRGIRYILDSFRSLPVDIFVMLPS
jgi:adenine deaminase